MHHRLLPHPRLAAADHRHCNHSLGAVRDARRGQLREPINCTDTQCSAALSLASDMADAAVYYRLENYYSSHRQYLKSKSDSQLRGNLLHSVRFAFVIANGVVAARWAPLVFNLPTSNISEDYSIVLFWSFVFVVIFDFLHQSKQILHFI